MDGYPGIPLRFRLLNDHQLATVDHLTTDVGHLSLADQLQKAIHFFMEQEQPLLFRGTVICANERLMTKKNAAKTRAQLGADHCPPAFLAHF